MRFLVGEAAAVIARSLVVADVHLGVEFEFRKRGVIVPLQAQRVARKLASLCKKHGCVEIVVVGDCKHDVFGFEAQERRMTRDFLAELRKANPAIKKFVVVKGNHDSQLDALAREIDWFSVAPPQGIVLRDESDGGASYGVFHGHAWPSAEVLRADRLLCAHLHPIFEFRDAAGAWRAPCWLVGSVKANKKLGVLKRECVVFPAFGALSGGTIVNKQRLIGVLFENELFDLRAARAFSLDGLNLGKMISNS